MSKFSDRTAKRLRLRHLLPLGLLLLVPIFLAPAGSAKPTPVLNFGICVQNASGTTLDPTTCSGHTSNFAGKPPRAGAGHDRQRRNQHRHHQLGQDRPTSSDACRCDARGVSEPQRHAVADSGHILVQGVNIQAGKSFVLAFNADTACGGSGTWTASAETTSVFSGTGSPSQTTFSAGDTSALSPGCHLSFVTQPAATANTTAIKTQAEMQFTSV